MLHNYITAKKSHNETESAIFRFFDVFLASRRSSFRTYFNIQQTPMSFRDLGVKFLPTDRFEVLSATPEKFADTELLFTL